MTSTGFEWLDHYADWSLARLDRWSGDLTRVLPRVVAMAPTEAGLVVLYSEEGAKEDARRPLRLGIVEPGGKTPREIPLDVALPRTKPGTYITPRLRLSAGHEGTVALYDDSAAHDIIVFDPTSVTVVGRVTPPDGASGIGRVWPVSDGVWMNGLLDGGDDFVRYVPFDGWVSLDLDPCTDVIGDCYAQVEMASDGGAWLSAWPYDEAFEFDLDRVVMRRHDATGQHLVDGFGRTDPEQPEPTIDTRYTKEAVQSSLADPTAVHGLVAGRYRLLWRTDGCERVDILVRRSDGDFSFAKPSASGYATAIIRDLPEGEYVIEQLDDACTDWSIELDWLSG